MEAAPGEMILKGVRSHQRLKMAADFAAVRRLARRVP